MTDPLLRGGHFWKLSKDSLQNVVISNSESAFFLKQEKLVGKGTDDVISYLEQVMQSLPKETKETFQKCPP